MLRTRAIPVLPPAVPPRSGSVQLDILLGEGTLDLDFMVPNTSIICIAQNINSELDMVRYLPMFAASNGVHINILWVAKDEYSVI